MSIFTNFCEKFYKKYFELNPTEAIYYGVEGYDHRLKDYSEEAYKNEKSFWREAKEEIRKISGNHLTRDEEIDYILLEGQISIENYTLDKEDYRLKCPDIYLPVSHIHMLTVRPSYKRISNVLCCLNGSTELIRQAIINLSRPDANPPRLWTQNAIEAAKGGTVFLDNLPNFLLSSESLNNPNILRNSIKKTKNVILSWVNFLEKDLLPRSSGSYPVGKEHYQLLLRKRHFLNLSAEELLSLGEKLFAKTKIELAKTAAEIAPGQSIQELTLKIQKNCPQASELLPSYQRAMEAARDFVRKNDLVSFPPREELKVVPTPEFERHVIPFAAYLPPSPNDSTQLGHYYVTPVTDNDLLREHNRIGLENTSVHESYPGHHLQFATANCIPEASTLPRLMNESTVFYEGWALYCEQLMQEQGFLGSHEHRFVMLKDRLWRSLRIIIDVKTQTGMMGYDEAANIMVRELNFPHAQAQADLNWYSQSPSGPMGYALGWSIINRLREQQRSKLGSRFKLREFHDRLLSSGSIALPLVEKRHFSE